MKTSIGCRERTDNGRGGPIWKRSELVRKLLGKQPPRKGLGVRASSFPPLDSEHENVYSSESRAVMGMRSSGSTPSLRPVATLLLSSKLAERRFDSFHPHQKAVVRRTADYTTNAGASLNRAWGTPVMQRGQCRGPFPPSGLLQGKRNFHRRQLLVPNSVLWSSGTDTALSRQKHGFDSRKHRQKSEVYRNLLMSSNGRNPAR